MKQNAIAEGAVLANDALPPNRAFEGTRINPRALQRERWASLLARFPAVNSIGALNVIS